MVVRAAVAAAAAIAAGPAKSVAAPPRKKAVRAAPAKPVAAAKAAARPVAAPRSASAPVTATDAAAAAPLQSVAAPAAAVATAAPALSAEASKWRGWRFARKRVVQPPPQPQDSMPSAAGSATASLFARNDEIEAAWRLVDPILQSWASKEGPPMAQYPAGSWGPREADILLAKESHIWRMGCGGH